MMRDFMAKKTITKKTEKKHPFETFLDAFVDQVALRSKQHNQVGS